MFTDQARERRNSARSKVYMLVQTSKLRNPLWARDIGLGGMQCSTSQWVGPGTFLQVHFRLPTLDETFEVGSQVLTVKEFARDNLYLGLRFCDVPDAARMAIYRFLDKRRLMWDEKAMAALKKKPVLLAAKNAITTSSIDHSQYGVPKLPFNSLLKEAYTSLRFQEIRSTWDSLRHASIRP